MYQDMSGQENIHMQGKVYMVLQALATDPEYQRRGIGSRLVRWGLDQADDEKLPCWIHASDSDVACRLYMSAGFQEVGCNAYDLDAWTPEGDKESGQRWGSYTFRYMLRPSKSA